MAEPNGEPESYHPSLSHASRGGMTLRQVATAASIATVLASDAIRENVVKKNIEAGKTKREAEAAGNAAATKVELAVVASVRGW